MPEEPVKRRYDARARRAAALATRDRICASAEELFVRKGYARTSIRTIATGAEVSEATVYLAFPNKAALLDAVILRAIRDSGSDGLDAILSSASSAVLRHTAEAQAVLMRRAARLIAIGESAALMDAELRPLRERAYRGVRAMMLAIADRLGEAGLLAPGLKPQAAADTLYAIGNERTYLRFVDDCGHPPERYAAWLAATLEAAVLDPQRAAGA
jgi:AcrR family transcriptional regulator